ACRRSPLPAKARPCRVQSCALPGEALSADRVNSTALSKSLALSAAPIGSVGSSRVWDRATEWHASRRARRPSLIRDGRLRPEKSASLTFTVGLYYQRRGW